MYDRIEQVAFGVMLFLFALVAVFILVMLLAMVGLIHPAYVPWYWVPAR